MFVRLAEGHRLTRALSGLALAGALALALGALGPVAQAAPKTNADPGSVTLDIVQPAANAGTAEGPVGANLLVQGTATPGDTIAFGIALKGDGCTTGSQPLNGVTTTAASDGSFSVTFQWPQIAANVGDRYFVCAQDTTNNAIGASQTLFRVDSTDAPAITVTQVNNPMAATPGAGTPTPEPPNPPDGSFYANGYVEVKGQNFTPGGIQIQILLTPSQLTPASAALPQLQIVSGAAVTRSNGTFDVIAQLPASQLGQFYLSATSSDGTSAVLPTLVGSQAVTIVVAPTPTAAPTATVPAKSSPTTDTGSTGGTKPGPGAAQIVGAIALGLFSAIFFIIGVAMLVSASGMGGAPTRPQPR